MNIKPLHPKFRMPTRATDLSGGFDLYMPEAGTINHGDFQEVQVSLGFAAQVPAGHVALILPRSGIGFKKGLALNNTVGVIDADYTGEWFASLRLQMVGGHAWDAGERLLQMLIVPVATPELVIVDELAETARGAGGFGSSGR